MKWILSFCLVCLTSMYIFPIEFSFLPYVNTKMIMAVLGVMVFVVNSIIQRNSLISRKVIYTAIAALCVTFVGVVSVLFNGTNDYTYASYFVSYVVWLSAAYFVINCIKFVHGKVAVVVVCNYLIAVALLQCILAIMLDTMPGFKHAVNSVVVGFASMHSAGEGLEKAGRLYGIGAALDVAGTRFCAILCMIGILFREACMKNNIRQQCVYVFSAIALFLIGSMISRTTGIGVLFLTIYFIVIRFGKSAKRALPRMLLILSIVTLGAIVLYRYNAFFYEHIRFAFEGFFNLLETGEWRLNSTDALKNMYVFPDSLKTWILGDGYFDEPYRADPFFVGEVHNDSAFYMGTDVGYIRFIYYFGLLGLSVFITYFVCVARSCIADFPKQKWVFLAIVLMNFMIWFKVATDIFCLFALFLSVSKEDNLEYEDSISNSLDI